MVIWITGSKNLVILDFAHDILQVSRELWLPWERQDICLFITDTTATLSCLNHRWMRRPHRWLLGFHFELVIDLLRRFANGKHLWHSTTRIIAVHEVDILRCIIVFVDDLNSILNIFLFGFVFSIESLFRLYITFSVVNLFVWLCLKTANNRSHHHLLLRGICTIMNVFSLFCAQLVDVHQVIDVFGRLHTPHCPDLIERTNWKTFAYCKVHVLAAFFWVEIMYIISRFHQPFGVCQINLWCFNQFLIHIAWIRRLIFICVWLWDLFARIIVVG